MALSNQYDFRTELTKTTMMISLILTEFSLDYVLTLLREN